ncbi:MAG: sugar transferase [Ilumatobacter sp.]
MTAWLASPLRRSIDATLATSLLVVLSIPMVAVGLAVRIVHGKPVILRQTRSGRGGQPFVVHKFRSMTDERGPDGELLDDERRLTPFGTWLRQSSLDELPQLWNVVRGEKSLIGPRPLPAGYDTRYSAHQARRLDALPGMSGWSQVSGRNELSWPDKLDLDVWYVDNATWRIDVDILRRTVGTIVRRGGVNALGHATAPEFLGDPVVAEDPRDTLTRS